MKVIVLGNFGEATNKLDGQTVKTRSLYELLNSYSSYDVSYYDTSLMKQNKRLFINLFINIIKVDYIFYLPAQNSLKFFFPLLFIYCKIFKVKITYFVIGGWLKDLLAKRSFLRLLVSRIECVFSETYVIKKELEENFKFKNVQYFPNFRRCRYMPLFKKVDEKCVKLVYVGRINEYKGITDLISILMCLFEKGINNFTLDLYGQVDKVYEDKFFNLLQNNEMISFKNVLHPGDIYNVVGEYDMMILPTKYYTEGLPGTVLDAYLSGIPVLVSKWKHAEEFVVKNVTGFIYDFNDLKCFEDLIVDVLINPSELNNMKIEAWKKSKEFSEEYALNILRNSLL